MTKFSIVTPSLNQGRFLAEALESVRLQNHPDVEHLILDCESTDNTVPLLQSLDGHAEWSHVCWRSERDEGQSDALNRGFKLAKGDIVGWLNADDRYRPGCFDRIAEAFAENPDVDVIYGDFTIMDEQGDILQVRREIEFNRFVLMYHYVLYIPTLTTFFRRRVFEDENWLQLNLHYAMDYEFFIRLAQAGYRFRHLPHILADFRSHSQSKSCRMERAQAEEKRQIMWAMAPISRVITKPFLRRIAIGTLQCMAAAMRWSEKLMRGYYFTQNSPGSLVK